METALLIQAVFFAAALFPLLQWLFSRPAFFQRCVGEATAGALGAIRMLVFSILLISALWENLPSTVLLPREMIDPSGVIRFLHLLPVGFDSFSANRTALALFQGVTILLIFLAAIGWKSKWTVPGGALCYLIMAGMFRQYAWFYHTGLVPLYVAGVLAFTPCGDGWSVDRLLAIARGNPAALRSGAVYGWARYACWAAIALPYMAAGMSKLRNTGWMWWNPDNMRNILYRDTLNPMQFEWTWALQIPMHWDWVFALLGLSGLYGELTFGLVLISRWARRILPALMAGMHVGIWLLQNVLFFDLVLLQAVFYDFTGVRKKAGAWLRRKTGGREVLFDGACPLCRRTVRSLQSLDLLEQIQFSDFRSGAAEEANRRHGLKITQAELEEQMIVIRKGRPLAGFSGYRALAAVLPLFWPVLPLLYLPGVPLVGQAIYMRVSRRRLQGRRCDSGSCPSEPSAEPPPQAMTARQRTAWPVGIAALSALVFFSWYARLEHYPFTAMQMYTNPAPNEIVYYRVTAQLEDGRWVRAYPERVIGAMVDARYRRCIRRGFQTGDFHLAELFLKACGAEHNRKAPPGRRWTALEIQKWIWDYQTSPDDKNRGELKERYTVSLGEDSA